MPKPLEQIQEELQRAGLDGWLFCDFRGSDPFAYRILGLPADQFLTRRWYFYLPSSGQPTKVVHSIESGALDALPGTKHSYHAWPRLHAILRETLRDATRIAMQYSPNNNIPYVSRVDAGTIEWIRSLPVEVVTSADLVQRFDATLTPEQRASHLAAADLLGRIVQDAFGEVEKRLVAGLETRETDVQRYILDRFESMGLMTDHAPIVAANAHSADPHFAPTPENTSRLRRGDFLLIDAWCKQRSTGSIYADITWVGFLGEHVPEKIERVFRIVTQARDAAAEFVIQRFAANSPPRGCDVDDCCRAVIEEAGFGEFFTHRTGHSIHESDHGNGANIDNLETHDDRTLLPSTCFSIEPGIYLPGEFGIRSEINVILSAEGKVEISGLPPQREIVLVRC